MRTKKDFVDKPFAANVSRIHTHDVDIAAELAERLYSGKVKAEGSYGFEWGANVLALGPMALVQALAKNIVRAELSPGRYLVLMARASTMNVNAPDYHSHLEPAGNAFVWPLGENFIIEPDSGWGTMVLVIEPAVLTRQFEALTGEHFDEVIQFQFSLDLSMGVGAYLQQTCRYIAAEFSGEGKQLPSALVANLCESLAGALLTSHPHSHSYLLERHVPPSSRTVVGLVEEYIDAAASRPILASDIAKVAGASMVSVEAAFKQHRGMSPMAFLRQRRLERARAALLADSRLSTASAAHMAGYLGVEAFESAYHKFFHESPAETKRRGLIGAGSKSRTSTPQAPEVRIARLSAREREVCDYVTKGLLNKQIAAEMGISEKTVQEYRGRALQKLGVHSVAELVTLWGQQGK